MVPDDLKPLINRLILTRWISSAASLKSSFNFKNKDLSFFRIRSEIKDQSEILDNFSAINGHSHQVGALYGNLEDVINIGRPKFKGGLADKYVIKDLAKRRSKSAIEESVEEPEEEESLQLGAIRSILPGDSPESQEEKKEEEGEVDYEENSRTRLPHLMWFIANEGRRIKTKEFDPEESSKNIRVPTLLLASESEIAQLTKDIEFENRFGLMDHFETIKLKHPTEKHKRNLIKSLFSRKQITQLGYQFSIGEENERIEGEQALNQLYRTVSFTRKTIRFPV